MLAAIAHIENEVEDIQENIRNILADPEQIQLDIENDPAHEQLLHAGKVVIDTSKETTVGYHTSKLDRASLLQQDQKFIDQIEVLNNLSVISHTLAEFDTNLQLLEVDNCFTSLRSMHKKYAMLSDKYITIISPQLHKSITSKFDEAHFQLLETIQKFYEQSYYQDQSKKILTVKKCSSISDMNLRDMDEFMKRTLLENAINIDNITSDNSMLVYETWFIDSIFDTSFLVEKCVGLLNSIILEFLKYESVIADYIKDPLFHSTLSITINKLSDTQWEVSKVKSKAVTSLVDEVENLINIIDLYDFLIGERNMCDSFHKLGQTIIKQTDKFVKTNIKSIFEPETKLNEKFLSAIAKSETLNDASLSNLLKGGDTTIFNAVLLDKIISVSFTEFRDIFKDPKLLQQTRAVEVQIEEPKSDLTIALKSEPLQNQLEKENGNLKIKTDDLELDDGWGWGEDNLDDIESKSVATTAKKSNFSESSEPNKTANNVQAVKSWEEELDEEAFDDGWGADDDILDLDDDIENTQSIGGSEVANTENKLDNDDLGLDDDAWSNDESLDLETVDEDKSNTRAKQHVVHRVKQATYFVTESTLKFLEFWQKINIRITEELPGDVNNKEYKLNMLLTAYYGLCTSQYDGDWIKFVNDFEYIKYEVKNNSIYKNFSSMNQFFHLGSNLVHTKIQLIEKRLNMLTNKQLHIIKDHESLGDPDWSITFDELLPYITAVLRDEILTIFSSSKKLELLLLTLTFFYEECIIKPISQWNVISEIASENISELIKLITQNIDDVLLEDTNGDVLEAQQFKDLRERVLTISKVLTARLNDIMDMFYNGEFYLFKTEEIINWIVLLFADTKKRFDCIEDIKSLREEAENENIHS